MAEQGTNESGDEARDEIEPGAVVAANTNVKRPSRCWASQAVVSLEMWAQ
jgi:hypothetical protein